MYDDEDDDFSYNLSPRPFSKWDVLRAASTFSVGVVRSLLIALDGLDDSIIGASRYDTEKKEFQDKARQDMEIIASGYYILGETETEE